MPEEEKESPQITFVSLDDYKNSESLNDQYLKQQSRVDSLNKAIGSCNREFERLKDTFNKTDIVFGISAAIGGISSLNLIPPDSRFQEYVSSIASNPIGRSILIATSIGGFAVAGISEILNRISNNRLEEIRIQQGVLQEQLEAEDYILKGHDNMRAINQIREFSGLSTPTFEETVASEEGEVPTIPSFAYNLPRIVVIDAQKEAPSIPQDTKDPLDFLPSVKGILDIPQDTDDGLCQ